MTSLKSYAASILRREANGLLDLSESLTDEYPRIMEILCARSGKIIVTGMGKSGHVARKVAATLASTGSPAFFLHPAEAAHGDLGMISPADVILALSNSGNTEELFAIIEYASRVGIPIIGITGKADSKLARHSTYFLVLPNVPEADPFGSAPTTSTVMQMALGDAIALTLMQMRGYNAEDFHRNHPGGALGKRLLLVDEIMHKGNEIPLVQSDESMRDALLVITGKGFGTTGVVEDGKLIGIITDGDLRRHLNGDLLEKGVKEVMNPHPVTVPEGLLASAALKVMQDKKISGLFVERTGQPLGYFNIHDCMRSGVR